ncbi:TlyA family RNA methyltransferase [Leucobacter aridicollis]|uniref:23S rRNA (Cytidine1920-2'-O)/16S rRNA (Cytidine1409-2'-O)-methyltransferase n=1 Tax=Leucobacter aridicollis TaxID=283878 RepID=A0A852R5A9_9MICO|nr:TlyA family RNA methyltransferase [Leucobacter aridicollis]NYD25649.1 23S rRNA (cytidine1920-2'-O)/16S rRNA (cytidine1409-2'-O)-methyltransferase [Leucobacter aridicollis]
MAAESRWDGPLERVDRAVVELGLVRSRSRAAELIGAGGIAIDGVTATKPGTRVRAGALVSVRGDDHYVSRGAHKLIAALTAFAIDPAGRLALDLGASTGGFTQVLLEHGAREVLAVDVGHDQLAPELRADPRVRVVEGCNARELDAALLATLTGVAERPSLVVADLSFISLTLILPAITRCTDPGAELALLIKPQFEVGRVRDGIVTDPALWREAILKVLTSAAENGLGVRGLAPSPIAGGEGNREFLVHLLRGEPTDPGEWTERIDEVCAPAYTREEGSGE